MRPLPEIAALWLQFPIPVDPLLNAQPEALGIKSLLPSYIYEVSALKCLSLSTNKPKSLSHEYPKANRTVASPPHRPGAQLGFLIPYAEPLLSALAS